MQCSTNYVSRRTVSKIENSFDVNNSIAALEVCIVVIIVIIVIIV